MAELLKDRFDKTLLNQLADLISQSNPGFQSQRFLNLVFDDNWKNLELKQRMRHITETMGTTINHSFEKQLKILKEVSAKIDDGLLGMVFPDFVERYGTDSWDLSVPALEWFTRFSSSEFAVRPFILQDQPRMLQQMLNWSKSKNYHVRRLASEGCRPRLPWAMALPELKKDPNPILPILENLKQDAEEYVQKSVANNLNDISKDNPELVKKIAKDWLGNSSSTDWIVKHACRTLLKQGNTDVLTLFGFGNPEKIDVIEVKLTSKQVKIGDEIKFQFTLVTRGKILGKIRLEYAIDYLKKNGKLSQKIFQISESEIKTEAKFFMRKQSFKDMSTRKHNAGKHYLKIFVNGKEKWQTDFNVC